MEIKLNDLRRVLRHLRESVDPTEQEFELGKVKILWNNTFDLEDQETSTRSAMQQDQPDCGEDGESEEDIQPLLVIAREALMEAAPPYWKHTVERMKKHKNITNPFALAWYMKKHGAKPKKKKKT